MKHFETEEGDNVGEEFKEEAEKKKGVKKHWNNAVYKVEYLLGLLTDDEDKKELPPLTQNEHPPLSSGKVQMIPYQDTIFV
jgi:hypothetical protein